MEPLNHALVPLSPVKAGGVEQKLGSFFPKDLLKRVEIVVKVSFSLQMRDHHYFRRYGEGDVVALVGTSTAGKTSIIQALKKLESDRLEDGVDLRFSPATWKPFQTRLYVKYAPEAFSLVEHYLKDPVEAVVSKDRTWTAEVPPEKLSQVDEAIKTIQETMEQLPQEEKEIMNLEAQEMGQDVERAMFDDSFERSRRGMKVIFDVLSVDLLVKHVLMRNFKGPLRIVLTYCPFHVLSSRMEKRNAEALKSGNLDNQRIGTFPFIQFSQIYSQKAIEQKAYERITRDDATRVFNDNFDGAIKSNMGSPEALSKEKESTRLKFLADLGFKEGLDELEIAPKNEREYHLVINSYTQIPEESAKIIQKGTYER